MMTIFKECFNGINSVFFPLHRTLPKLERNKNINFYPRKTSVRMPHHLSTSIPAFSPSPATRRYHPTLSIWLSVDPMADKYPSTSPYTYCANNPVRLVDKDGRDYEAVIDQDNKTITLKANIYTYTDELLQQLQSPVKELNGTHKKVEIDGREYSVSFQINMLNSIYKCNFKL